jgi:Spy/CpxP family protein refolding chaperone
MRRGMKAAVVAAVTLAMLVVGSSAAMADAPKFHAASGSVNNDGALVVSFDERGLGNENVDYTRRPRTRKRSTPSYRPVPHSNQRMAAW